MCVFDEVLAQEVIVPTVEHGYQADKTIDPLWRKAMLIGERGESGLNTPSASEVKKLGQKVHLREDWTDAFKVQRMMFWLRLKFSNWDLRKNLLATEDAVLVEGNTWGDVFWGVFNGQGQNYLGRSLMKVREEILKSGA